MNAERVPAGWDNYHNLSLFDGWATEMKLRTDSQNGLNETCLHIDKYIINSVWFTVLGFVCFSFSLNPILHTEKINCVFAQIESSWN